MYVVFEGLHGEVDVDGQGHPACHPKMMTALSIASLAANVAVAEPTLVGRVIAAWPSFALTVSFELSPGA